MSNRLSKVPWIILIFFQIIFGLTSYGQKRLAVLIGNQDYSFQSDLSSPNKEINEISKICILNGYTTLKYADLDYDDFKHLFDTIEVLLPHYDFFYFHYSGHGIQLENENYFVPVDVSPISESQLKRQCHGMSTLIELIRNWDSQKPKSSLLCLDACRSNPFEESHIDVPSGLCKYDYLPTRTALIYSTNPGRTSLDGRDNFSPFAASWINRISQCENSIHDIVKLINGDILKKGINPERQPYTEFNGFPEVGFCNSFVSGALNQNVKTLLNSLISEAQIDKELGHYKQALGKIQWIDTVISRQTGFISLHSKNLLRLKSECLIGIDEFYLAEKHLINLWKELRQSGFQNIESRLIFNVYSMRHHCLTILGKTSELRQLRNEYLNYCDFKNDNIEKINTIDKMAGDFERISEWDSSLHYYSYAISLIDSITMNRRNAASTFHIFANYGNALIHEGRFSKGIEEVKKANEICLRHGFNQIWLIEDIANFYTFIDYSLDSANKYINVFDSLLHKPNNYTLDLDIEKTRLLHYIHKFNNGLHLSDKSEYYFNNWKTKMDSIARYKVLYHNKRTVEFTEGCSLKVLSNKIELLDNFIPVFLIDAQHNGTIDEGDFIINFEIKFNNSVSSNSIRVQNSENDNTLVWYRDEKALPEIGLAGLVINQLDSNLNEHLIKTLDQVNIVFESIGDNMVIWNIELPLSELPTTETKLKLLHGIKHLYSNEIIIYPLKSNYELYFPEN